MGIRTLLDRARHEIELPQIVSERCVHSLIEQASCRACVDACPHGAWILNDEELALDTEACDGCGLCRPACPQSAISHDHQPEVRNFNGRNVALVACERAGVEGEGVVPCLNALDTSFLIQAINHDIHNLLYTRGNCTQCDRSGHAQSFDELTENFCRMLASHGLKRLVAREYQPREWEERRKVSSDESRAQGFSRRGFLGNLMRHAVTQGLHAVSEGLVLEHTIHLSDLLPANTANGIYPHVPKIDPSNCVGCDACVNLCPHHAIVLCKEFSDYCVDARLCTGCGMCVDVCDAQALQIRNWAKGGCQTVVLRQGSCDTCGVPFHYPQENGQERSLCHICAVSDRKSHLYQVMEN